MGTTAQSRIRPASAPDRTLDYLRRECAEYGARLLDYDIVALPAREDDPFSHLLYAAIDDGGDVGAHILRCHLDPEPGHDEPEVRIEHLLDAQSPALVDGVSMRLISRLTRTGDPDANQWRLQAVRRTVLRTPFLAVLGRVDRLLDTDRRRAREAFMHALAATTAEEFAFLDKMAAKFTDLPYHSAMKWIVQLAAKNPDQREFLRTVAPTSDPGLYQRRLAGLDMDLHQVQLGQIDMPRMSSRKDSWLRGIALHRSPGFATDQRTHDAVRVAARAARRAQHQRRTEGEMARARWEDDLFTAYADTRLFVDDHPKAALPEWHPHNTVGDDARTRWARTYFTHVAEGLGPEIAWRRKPQDSDSKKNVALTRQANEMLKDTGPGSGRRDRRTDRMLRDRSVTDSERQTFARNRTGMRLTDDTREDPMYRGDDDWTEHEPEDYLDLDEALGWPCMSCFIERSVRDQRPVHIRDGVMTSDDGLCDHCRADGRPGIAPLALPFTFEQFVHSRCEYLLDTYPAIAAAMLVQIYRRSAPHPLCRVLNRFYYQRFGVLASDGLPLDAQHAEPDTTATPRKRRGAVAGAGQRQGRCNGCTRYRAVNANGYCTECCVALGMHQPAATGTTAA